MMQIAVKRHSNFGIPDNVRRDAIYFMLSLVTLSIKSLLCISIVGITLCTFIEDRSVNDQESQTPASQAREVGSELNGVVAISTVRANHEGISS